MPTNPPRTYQHQLTEAEFVFAFTATNEEFATRADDMRQKGVQRLTGAEIQEQYNIFTDRDSGKHWFTYISEAEITANGAQITLSDLTEPVPGLVLDRCLLPDLHLNKCALAGRTDQSAEAPATAFMLKESTTGNFWIEDKSTTGDFMISGSSTTGNFWIKEKSTTGDFRIWEKSATGDFKIGGSSTTGFFRIDNSQCAGFSGTDLFCSFSLTGPLYRSYGSQTATFTNSILGLAAKLKPT